MSGSRGGTAWGTWTLTWAAHSTAPIFGRVSVISHMLCGVKEKGGRSYIMVLLIKLIPTIMAQLGIIPRQ